MSRTVQAIQPKNAVTDLEKIRGCSNRMHHSKFGCWRSGDYRWKSKGHISSDSRFFIPGTIWANESSMPHAKQHNRIKTEQRCLCLWGWPLRPIKLFTDADSHALWLCDPCSATPTISFYDYNTLQSPSTAVENSLWPRAMINWCGARPPSQENCSTLWTFQWQLIGNAKTAWRVSGGVN